MTYSILIVAYRKPDLTPEEFRDYYNDRHVPLIREITGEYVPNTAIIHTCAPIPVKLPTGSSSPG